MKRIIILIGLLLSATAYPQNIFQQAQNCFDNGDYECAIDEYNSLLKNADYKIQIKAKLKLLEVLNIVEELEKAQNYIDDFNYIYAKQILQHLVKINPNDLKIKSRLEECNQKKVLFLSTTPNNLIFSHKRDAKKIKVTTNSKSWRVLKDRTPSWISTTTNSDILSVSCSRNRKKERVGLIYIKYSDTLEHVIRITQKGKR